MRGGGGLHEEQDDRFRRIMTARQSVGYIIVSRFCPKLEKKMCYIIMKHCCISYMRK